MDEKRDTDDGLSHLTLFTGQGLSRAYWYIGERTKSECRTPKICYRKLSGNCQRRRQAQIMSLKIDLTEASQVG